MRLGKLGIDRECRFVVLARRNQFAGLQKEISQIHVRHGLIGMLADGFGVRAARRRAISGEIQQCAQIVQRAHMPGHRVSTSR